MHQLCKTYEAAGRSVIKMESLQGDESRKYKLSGPLPLVFPTGLDLLHRFSLCHVNRGPSYSHAMAENDEIQAFLKVMANLHALSDLNAAENVANQLIALRKRDQESGTVIYRLTEENASLIRQSKAAAGERRTLDSAVKDLEDRMTQLKKDCTDINKVANERERRLKDKSAKVAQLEQHRVNLAQGSKDEVYVCAAPSSASLASNSMSNREPIHQGN